MGSIIDLHRTDINKKIPAYLIINQDDNVRWVIIWESADKFEEALNKLDEIKIQYPKDKLWIVLKDIEPGTYPPEIIS